MIAKSFVLAKTFYPMTSKSLRDDENPLTGYPGRVFMSGREPCEPASSGFPRVSDARRSIRSQTSGRRLAWRPSGLVKHTDWSSHAATVGPLKDVLRPERPVLQK